MCVKSRYLLIFFNLILFLTLAWTTSYAQNFSVYMRVDVNGFTQDLIIGFHPDATDGFDSLDIAAPPSIPDSGGGVWLSNDPNDPDCVKDIRASTTQNTIFTIEYNPQAEPVTLQWMWDSSCLPYLGSFTITDINDNPVLDMTDTDSLIITSADTPFIYTHTTIKIHVQPFPPASPVVVHEIPDTLVSVAFGSYEMNLNHVFDSDPPDEPLSYSVSGESPIRLTLTDSILVVEEPSNPSQDDSTFSEIIVSAFDCQDTTRESFSVCMVTNQPPESIDLSGDLQIQENMPIGEIIGILTTSDPDMEDQHTYEIEEVDSPFQIAGDSLQTAQIFDYEFDYESDPRSIRVTILSTDNGLPSYSFDERFYIEITDVNDAPVIADTTLEISENSPQGTILGTVPAASDEDMPQQSLTYSLIDSDETGTFSIDSANGEIFVEDPTYLNYETDPIMTIHVRVEDDGSPALSDTARIDIALIDVNDAPVIEDAAFDISENSPQGTILGAVSAADEDDRPSQLLTYSLIDSDETGTFSINSTNGEIFVEDPTNLNYEEDSTHTVIAVVIDDGSPALSDSGLVEITVTNVNDAPEIYPPPGSATVTEDGEVFLPPITVDDEDAGQGNWVVTLSADHGVPSLGSDEDVHVSEINSFSIEISGTLNALNTVLSTVIYRPDLNYNGIDSLTIDLNDQGHTGPGDALTDQAKFGITIDLVNDAPELSAPLGISVGEDMPTLIQNFFVSDIDVNETDPPDNTLEITLSASHGFFIIAGDNAEFFVLTGDSATLNTTLGSLYYQGDPNYTGDDTIHVVVNDLGHSGAGTALADSADILVEIRATNDPPVIHAPVAVRVLEDSLLRFTADSLIFVTDPDIGGLILRVQLSVTHSILTVANTEDVTFETPLSGTQLEFYGRFSSVNNALSIVTYRGPPDWSGSDELSINAWTLDPIVPAEPKSVEIIVIPVNDAPTANSANLSTEEDEDTPVCINLRDLVSDLETPPLQLTFAIAQVESGEAVLNPNGHRACFTPVENFYGDTFFTYTVTDLGQDDSPPITTDPTRIEVHVDAINDPPDIRAPVAVQVLEDSSLWFTSDSLITLSDPDTGSYNHRVSLSVTNGVLALSSETGSSSMEILGTLDSLNNVLTTLVYHPDLNYNGSDALQIRLNDYGHTRSIAERAVDISVVSINDPPVSDDDLGYVVDEDEQLGGSSVLSNDSDLHNNAPNENNLPLTAHVVTDVLFGELTLYETGGFLYQPNLNFSGLDSFIYIAVDNPGGESDPAVARIRVIPVNDPPQLTVNTLHVTHPVGDDLVIRDVSVSDLDAGQEDIQITLSADQGTISLVDSTDISVSFDPEGMPILTGSQAALHAALAQGITYSPNLCRSYSDVLTIRADDQGHSGEESTPLSDSAAIQLDIVDDIAPTARCQSQLVVQLDAMGQALLHPSDIDNGSDDNCGIASLRLSGQQDESESVLFSCDQVGQTIEATLVAMDSSGLCDSCFMDIQIENIYNGDIDEDMIPDNCDLCSDPADPFIQELNIPGGKSKPFTPPVQLTNAHVGTVFDSIPRHRLYSRRKSDGEIYYLNYNDYLEIGRAYYIRTGERQTKSVEFSGCDVAEPVLLTRDGSWQAFFTGNPYPDPILMCCFVLSPPDPEAYFLAWEEGKWHKKDPTDPEQTILSGAAMLIYSSADSLHIWKTPPSGSLPIVEDFEWLAKLQVRCGDVSDEDTYFGVHKEAHTGYDVRFDRAELLSHELEFVRAIFRDDTPKNSNSSGSFLHKDIRSEVRDMEIWEMELDASASGKKIELTWDLPQVDPELSFTLIDLETGEEIDMRSTKQYVKAHTGDVTVEDTEIDRFSRIGALPVMTANTPRSGETYPFRIVAKKIEKVEGITNLWIGQNQPNPFKTSTKIVFQLPYERRVKIDLYNIAGQRIRTLWDEETPTGQYSVNWDGTNDRGEPVRSGVYFYRLQTTDQNDEKATISKRLIYFGQSE